MLSQEIFKKRRQKLFDAMIDNSVSIVISASEHERTNDVVSAYRQDGNFYYLTGIKESHCAAVLFKRKDQCVYYFFSRVRDPLQRQWFGDLMGQEGAISSYGADSAFPLDLLDEKMLTLLSNCRRVYYSFGRRPEFDARFNAWIVTLRKKVRAAINAPHEITNLDKIVHEMRLIKDADELALIQKAIDIDGQAQIRACKTCKPGMYEYELEAEIRYEFVKNGAMHVSFDPIIAGGANACTLHYGANNQKLNDGDLVLVDIGCEYEYYASDLTRTFPVNGKFSPEQKAIYELVLEAQLAAIEKIGPKYAVGDAHKVSVEVITRGLCKLGILQGDLATLIKEDAYKPFYMHHLGHWMGLDAHDVGEYYIDGKGRPLRPGMIQTAEPGIYINPNTPGVDKKWWGIGVRIEDDVLVTQDGYKVLSAAVPKTVDEIEHIKAAK